MTPFHPARGIPPRAIAAIAQGGMKKFRAE